jgi:hypothetical protein
MILADAAAGVAALSLRYPSSRQEASRTLRRLCEAAPVDAVTRVRKFIADSVREVVENPIDAMERNRKGTRLNLERSGQAWPDPPDDALVWAANFAGPLMADNWVVRLKAFLTFLPFAVRLQPEELYLPKHRLDEWTGEYEPEDALNLLRATPIASAPPVRAPATPRPNDACPCGSGKKFKRCCALRQHWPLRKASRG